MPPRIICTRHHKHSHETPRAALSAALNTIKRRPRGEIFEHLSIFRCGWCQGWHWGHKVPGHG